MSLGAEAGVLREFLDTVFPLGEEFKQFQAVRIGDRLANTGEFSVDFSLELSVLLWRKAQDRLSSRKICIFAQAFYKDLQLTTRVTYQVLVQGRRKVLPQHWTPSSRRGWDQVVLAPGSEAAADRRG